MLQRFRRSSAPRRQWLREDVGRHYAQMISFIVPAHNEEAWVDRCVSAIRNGAESLGEPHEIIVVDDASSDATASIARQQGAQVVRVEHRLIAGTRNTGVNRAPHRMSALASSLAVRRPPRAATGEPGLKQSSTGKHELASKGFGSHCLDDDGRVARYRPGLGTDVGPLA